MLSLRDYFSEIFFSSLVKFETLNYFYVFVFGLFVLQLGQGLDEDPRLRVLKKSWFEGKDCLDIGCNCGVITIQIGIFFSPIYLNFYSILYELRVSMDPLNSTM